MIILFFHLVQALASNCTYPMFTFGDLNLTSERQYKELLKKEDLFILSVSAKWCRYCCMIEENLEKILPTLSTLNIKLVRADLSTQLYLSKTIDKNDVLPHTYIAYKGTLKRYDYPIDDFLFKYISIYSTPFKVLSSESSISEFLDDQEAEIKVIGYIYDTEEYLETYKLSRIHLIDWYHAKFALVTDRSLIKLLKPSILYINSLVVHKAIDKSYLDLEFDKDITSFICKHSVNLVNELTVPSFQVYKTIGLPMLILFIDLSSSTSPELLSLFEKAARDYENLIKFVWMDGNSQVTKEKRKAIGLVTDTLPAMGFNLLDGRVFPYDEKKTINLKSIQLFCTNFLENRLKEGVKKVIKGKNPQIEEKFRYTKTIGIQDLDSLVFSEGTDVMLLVYESSSEKSLNLAPNFNKAALRFGELDYPKMKVYRIDADNEPVQTVIGNYALPAILFFPAFHKLKPYIQYTGEGKAVQLMFFAQKYADVKFELPELPHLSPDQISAYWEQVSELGEEKRAKVAEANERRDWGTFF